MDEPEYLIMNPLQMVLIYKKTKNITEIEERFYNKIGRTKKYKFTK